MVSSSGLTGQELLDWVTEREREEKEKEGRREEMAMRKIRAEITKAQLESEILGEENIKLRDENKFLTFKIEALEANMDHYTSSKASVEGLPHRVIALENMVLKLGKHHYVQTLGIPQGSLLSTIPCGAYYGHLDRTMLLRIVDRGDFFIRMVDDILLVTRNKMTAQDFLRIFLEGIPTVGLI
ncbi:hypothetical protein Btru_054252 [Bulinus truncatus]|nr:hypothetical protein Btru_054252 [Bulinus truncatus]